jgi:hypothetical protein
MLLAQILVCDYMPVRHRSIWDGIKHEVMSYIAVSGVNDTTCVPERVPNSWLSVLRQREGRQFVLALLHIAPEETPDVSGNMRLGSQHMRSKY